LSRDRGRGREVLNAQGTGSGADAGTDPIEVRAHGSLVEVFGVGVLLVGPSGIGKSECALDLVARGHPLVADDIVQMRRDADGERLVGRAPDVIRFFMEIRGIGLLYLPDLYGTESVRESGPVDLACRLVEWREGLEFDRVGLERASEVWAGVSLPVVRLPARPAGSMATLVELAARDHLQRRRGIVGAERIDARLRGEESE
jgi:HPr kinase/phosphorylase